MTEFLTVTAPYDGRVLRDLPLTSLQDAQRMLSEMHTMFQDRTQRLEKPARIAILTKFRQILEERAEALALEATLEGGKPLTDSLIEVNRAVNGVDIAIREIANLKGTEIPMSLNAASVNHMAYTMLEPAGVVIALSAFNHPMNLIIHQVIPAIAAGCPVLVKPASATPLSCFSIVGMLHEAGLPQQWARAIVCDNETASKLASDERVAFVTFIGSAKVGWRIRSMLAPGARCALEHGGAAPVIIEPDADLDVILPGIVKGGYYHAGQVCVSVQRAYVHTRIMQEIRRRILPMITALRTGDPALRETDIGPLIKRSEVDRVQQWVSEAVAAGAELLCGGKRISATCFEPTLLVNPPDDAKVSQQEIFGPVLCLYEYEEYGQAIERANALPFTFQASVFTKNLDVALDCVKRLKGTAVMVNEHTAFRVDWMPFGGAQHSGLGMGGIGYSMRDMSHEKLMVIKSPSV